MALAEHEAHRLVDQLDQELSTRRPEIDRNARYYRGEQPLRFASAEWRKFHGDRYAGFSDNWVATVSDAPVERLTVQGVQPLGATSADTDSWRTWMTNGLDMDSQLAFTDAVNSGRTFALVWGDEDGNPRITFEAASQCVVAYAPGSRRVRTAALKRWTDGETDFATLYLPDEIWRLERAARGRADRDHATRQADEALKKWQPRRHGPAHQRNPLGVVPMVELQNRPLLAEEPLSDVTGVVAMQDAINLIWTSLFVAVDFASFPQRIVLGGERPMIPVLNDAGEVVGERPIDLERFAVDRVAFFSGDGVRTDQWDAADLSQFTSILDVMTTHVAARTRTPQHYLVGKMANLSGDALLAAETGLVKRVEEKQLFFGHGLREVFALAAMVEGDWAKADALRAGTIIWRDAESRSNAQLADSLLKLRQMGFPFEWLAGQYGLTPTEVANVLAMREREAALDPVTALADLTERAVLDDRPGE